MTATRPPEQDPMILVLQTLIDQLNAPDLTVTEANDLRPRLLRVIDAIEAHRPTRPVSKWLTCASQPCRLA